LYLKAETFYFDWIHCCLYTNSHVTVSWSSNVLIILKCFCLEAQNQVTLSTFSLYIHTFYDQGFLCKKISRIFSWDKFCNILLYCKGAFHKSNPSSFPRGIVDLYCTVPWVTWEAATVVEVILWWGLLQHKLANGAVVYPSQGGRYHAEGCMALV